MTTKTKNAPALDAAQILDLDARKAWTEDGPDLPGPATLDRVVTDGADLNTHALPRSLKAAAWRAREAERVLADARAVLWDLEDVHKAADARHAAARADAAARAAGRPPAALAALREEREGAGLLVEALETAVREAKGAERAEYYAALEEGAVGVLIDQAAAAKLADALATVAELFGQVTDQAARATGLLLWRAGADGQTARDQAPRFQPVLPAAQVDTLHRREEAVTRPLAAAGPGAVVVRADQAGNIIDGSADVAALAGYAAGVLAGILDR